MGTLVARLGVCRFRSLLECIQDGKPKFLLIKVTVSLRFESEKISVERTKLCWGMLLLRVQVQSLNHTHSNCPTKDPVSFDFPTPSSPIYTHLKRYFQDNDWVLDISRTIMFSVSWFARNTAIVIYNNYFNDNGSNKNEDT